MFSATDYHLKQFVRNGNASLNSIFALRSSLAHPAPLSTLLRCKQAPMSSTRPRARNALAATTPPQPKSTHASIAARATTLRSRPRPPRARHATAALIASGAPSIARSALPALPRAAARRLARSAVSEGNGSNGTTTSTRTTRPPPASRPLHYPGASTPPVLHPASESGKFSGDQAATCEACPGGYFSAAGADNCTVCGGRPPPALARPSSSLFSLLSSLFSKNAASSKRPLLLSARKSSLTLIDTPRTPRYSWQVLELTFFGLHQLHAWHVHRNDRFGGLHRMFGRDVPTFRRRSGLR